jgi:hypothetical protein
MARYRALLAASTIAASQYEIRSETKLAKVQVSFLPLDSLVVQKSGLGVFAAWPEIPSASRSGSNPPIRTRHKSYRGRGFRSTGDARFVAPPSRFFNTSGNMKVVLGVHECRGGAACRGLGDNASIFDQTGTSKGRFAPLSLAASVAAELMLQILSLGLVR